jgi:nucleoside-diphosphate-sugar epimerase
MNEELAQVFARCFGMSFVGLRYFNVYGQRQDPNGPYAAVIPKFFEAYAKGGAPCVHGRGDQTRDFVHVSDVARANFLAARATLDGAVAINIGAGGQTTIAELAHTIGSIMGSDQEAKHTDPRAGDVQHSRADISRARTLLGFEPQLDLSAGLELTKPHA